MERQGESVLGGGQGTDLNEVEEQGRSRAEALSSERDRCSPTEGGT